jgi:AraC-like DNA-binding protein
MPATEQHEAWREWFGRVFDVEPRDPSTKGFAAENQIWTLDGLVASRVFAPAARVVRTKAHVRRDPVDHWVLTYCRRGATVIRTERGSLEAGAGLPFLWSLGEASESERTAVDRLQLFLSRDAFRDIAPLLDAARGRVLDSPLGRLLGDFMMALEHQLPGLAAADAPRLTAAVRALVAACVAPTAERVAILGGSRIDLGRLERVRQTVRKHLRSPALGPKLLCRAVGMSRSNLYRLLDEAGGVTHYIQRQRLREAHAMLSDPSNTRAICAVAEDLCFADASTFGRAFRKEFGHSPSDVRAAGPAGLPLPTRLPATSAAGSDFGALLRGV